jgi:23S rRNA pseudouridine1911/1915/1917 synthase
LEPEVTRADSGELVVLLEDNHLLAANKPPGLLTQPTERDEDSLETRAREWVRRTKDKPGNVFLHAVHRLDREASGVVLFARTSKALSRLNEEIRARRVEKIYHAWVEGMPPEEEGTLTNWIAHGEHAAKIVKASASGAKQATLAYRALRRIEDLTLLEIRLDTGRYHQIRAQLAAAGCPISGDGRYRSREPTPGRILLHHRRLTVAHPVQKGTVVIEADYPSGWPGRRVSSTTGPPSRRTGRRRPAPRRPAP